MAKETREITDEMLDYFINTPYDETKIDFRERCWRDCPLNEYLRTRVDDCYWGWSWVTEVKSQEHWDSFTSRQRRYMRSDVWLALSKKERVEFVKNPIDIWWPGS
jgi:hypothetical protein